MRPSLPSTTPPEGPRPRRARGFGRFALGLAAGLGLSIVFVSSFAVALLAHLNAPSARRAIARIASDAASKSLRGRVDVVSIDHISPRALDVGEITLRDPTGRPVASLYGGHVHYDLVELGKAFLGKTGATPTIDRVVVERFNVALIPNEEGVPTFVDAIAARAPTPKKGPAEAPPGTFRLSIPAIDVRWIEAWGTVGNRSVSAQGEIEKAAVTFGPEGPRIDASRVRVDVAPIADVVPASTTIDASGSVRFPPFPTPDDLGVAVEGARIDLQTAGAHASIAGSIEGGSFDARIEVTELTPDAVAKLTGAPPPVLVPLSVVMNVRGTKHLASVDGAAHLGDAFAMIDGAIDLDGLGATPNAKLPRVALAEASLHLRGVDPATFVPGAPSLGVSSDLLARAVKTTRGTEIDVDGDASTTIDGHGGNLDIQATALIGKNDAIDASGKVRAKLGRNDAALAFDAHKRGAAGTAHADFTASASELAELRALHGQPLRGRVDLSGAADLDFGAQTLSMSARVHAIGLSHPSVAIPEGVVSLDVDGPLKKPTFTAGVVAEQIVLSPTVPDPHRLHEVDLKATGTPDLVAVEGKFGTDANQRVVLSTHIAPTSGGARIAGTKLRLARDTFAGELAVNEVTLDRGAVTITGLRLSSTAGGLRLDGAFDPKRHHVTINAASTPLDLAALAHGAGVEVEGLRGTLTVDAKIATIPVDRAKLVTGNESGILQVDPNDAPLRATAPVATAPYVTGHVKLDLDDGQLPSIGGVDAHIDVDVEDRLVAGDVAVAMKDLARVALHGAALVPGRLDDLRAWRDASTHVDLRIPDVDLQKVSAFLARQAPEGSQVTQYAGIVDVVGHVERRHKNAPPTGFLELDTHGLALESGGTRIEGIDLRVRAGMEGEHDDGGELRADAPVRVFGIAEARDDKGPLAIVHVGTEGAWDKLRKAGDAIADLPFALNVIVPPRELDRMPQGVGGAVPLHGTLAVGGHGEGTLGAPKIDLRARLEGIAGNNGSLNDADVTITYDGALAKLGASLTNRKDVSHELLSLDGELRLSAMDVLSGGKIPWTAKLDAKFDGAPLELLAVDGGVTGALRGEVHIDHVNDPAAKAATVDGRIDIDKFKVGNTLFEESYVVMKVDEHAATATVRVHGTDGTLDGRASVPLVWANAASPAIAPGAAVDAALDADNFRLRVVEPFVMAVDALDGRLDAHLVAHLRKKPQPDGDGTYEGAPEGTITLREGVVVADAVGERWDHIAADMKLQNGRLELPKLELRGRRKGRATISGWATLDGVMPKTFHVDVDAKRFSFAQEGVRVGDISGKIAVDGKTVRRPDRRKEMQIDVKLDPLTIDLAAEAGKQVQPLDNDPTIIVAQPIGPPMKRPGPPGTGTPIRLALHIPNVVWVRRDDLRIAVTGNPTIAIDGIATFAGEVRIEANPSSVLRQRSWIEVAGKRFFVQQSRIAFAGNEDFDPELDIEVRWQAPDRSIVQVKVTDHLKTPKITFHALDESGAPLGLTQGEVMSLLVLGRREAGSATQQREAERGAASQTAALVSGMTGAIVGRQLQKLLPTSMSLSLAPGRYSGGYQAKNIYFEIAYNAAGARMGPQAIGQTVPRTTFGVEWRFARMWSLMTTIGDTGSTLVDLLWQYRY